MHSSDEKKMMRLVDQSLQSPKYAYPMQKNAPRPSVPEFAAVRLLKEHNPGQDSQSVVTLTDGTDVLRVEGVRILLFQILFTEADIAPAKFLAGFRRQDVIEVMTEEKLSILRYQKVNNESLTLEQNWEIRDSVLVECLVNRSYDFDINTINAVEIDGTYNEGDRVVELHLTVAKDSP